MHIFLIFFALISIWGIINGLIKKFFNRGKSKREIIADLEAKTIQLNKSKEKSEKIQKELEVLQDKFNLMSRHLQKIVATRNIEIEKAKAEARLSMQRVTAMIGFKGRGIESVIEALEEEKEKTLNLTKNEREFRHEISHLQSKLEEKEHLLKQKTQENDIIKKSIHEDTPGYPTLINLLDCLEKHQDVRTENSLRRKSRPALKAAEVVKKETNRRRKAEKERDQAKSLLEYYAHALPAIGDDYKTITEVEPQDAEEKQVDERDDQVSCYLTKEEYARLTTTERNQIALDRFWERHKSKRLIGQLYEQYVGYLFEKEGYEVEYVGINQGVGDLGRDLICRKQNENIIIQCKNWSKSKTIYEKHIFQFFGTIFQYKQEHPGRSVRGIFYTSTTLSDLAKSFAKEFDIEIVENFSLQRYPIIKCNIGKEGDRIYHLPFDQQYNTTKIKGNGECYCETVAEAEKLGFRRAHRWLGERG
nr:restriction endonuclease [uncultured Dethiosulfovibrio sp.]